MTISDPDAAGVTPTPRQLPGDIRGFVNRTEELEQLNAVLPSAEGAPLVVSLCVIAGTAGAGKTSLALRWAHQAQHRFPDGQLYINLRGYDPDDPVTVHEALHRFLTALGVPAASVPAEPDAAAALYRSLLADRRMLVLLDNAATATQVRALIPGSAGCLTVVTSRSRLSGLAIRDGAHRLTLGTLPEPEAVALMRAVTAGYRPADDPAKLAELAQLCAHLPLALRIAAERAVTHPHLSLDDLIAELRDESALWDALSVADEDEAAAVRTVFAWSYRALRPEAARLFRLLGLHPGPEFSLDAAAALAGARTSRVRQLLDILVAAHLLGQPAPDRYAFHDLLRAYAADQARHEEPADQRAAARRRVLDWYLHTADAAQTWLEPEEAHQPLQPPAKLVTALSFPDYDTAADWAEHEHTNLLAAIRTAAAEGLDHHAWQLPAVLWNARGPSASALDFLEAGNLGLAAARRLGDRAAEATLLEDLGMTHTRINEFDQSQRCHEDALTLRRALGDREGEANSLNLLGLTALNRRQLGAARAYFERAITIFEELGATHFVALARSNLAVAHHRAGRLAEAHVLGHRLLATQRAAGARSSEGNILRLLSENHLERGEPEEALRLARQAVDIALDLRNQYVEAYWLISLGAAQLALGQHGEALDSYQRSASLNRRLRNRGREALAWLGAGRTYQALGRHDEAADFHRQAAATFGELRDPWHRAVALEALADALDSERPDQAAAHRAEALRLIAPYDDLRATRARARIAHHLPPEPRPTT